MTFVQRVVSAVFPGMEAEAKEWMAQCGKCGKETSIWEHGGVRAGAAGNPSRLLTCPHCGERSMQKLVRRPGTAGKAGGTGG